MTERSYAFGDSPGAAERLRILSDVFAPSTFAFLTEAGPRKPRLAVDLGCGPGYSTVQLAEALEPDETVGLDSSEAFIETARASGKTRIRFKRHDVTTTPFPVGPADVLHCRFLLSHLVGPASVIDRWCTQLRSGGRLLVQEVERIRTESPIFQRYLAIVDELLRSRGQRLYVGEAIGTIASRLGATTATRRLAVDPISAVRMFLPNLASWRDDSFVIARYGNDRINDLRTGLEALTRGTTQGHEIEWELRELVFVRDD